MGRGTPLGRERTGANTLEAELAVAAQQLALQSAFADATRDDGWQVREILAHCADVAEVFCERLAHGSCPGATTTAVRRGDGSVDLEATNARLRVLRGKDPILVSLGRIEHCVRIIQTTDVSFGTHAARRVRDHTLEHLAEIAVIERSLTRGATRRARSTSNENTAAISPRFESHTPTSR